ncbi:IS66 family transposase [Roseiconus lacunae]|uniref:IS66 family transposase n=1 Tax=Roseiconus lacunae TaxID=2605694 RepID=UPI001E60DE30|nr:transposase [Roseiconus lacunae]MCD0462049.1 transposase [Roseiconus lacunae]
MLQLEPASLAAQGRHELQTSDATGAAAGQLGPNVHAAMALLNKELGLSHGRVKRLLEMLFEITVGRSASCRSMLRTAKRLESAHEAVRHAVRGSPQVVGDETAWPVDGRPAWLHVFVGLTATACEIDPTRSIEPAERLLGRDWSGIFGRDDWSVYDKFTAATHQHCFAHLLRRCESLSESGTSGALAFPRAVKSVLLKGLEYRNRYRAGEMTAHGLKVMAGHLTMRMRDLVRPIKTHVANKRFATFLDNHLDDLFNFLRFPGADATNWRGEQAIRPVVVNRKVWGGNRSEAGATAQSIIMGVMRTCIQRLAITIDAAFTLATEELLEKFFNFLRQLDVFFFESVVVCLHRQNRVGLLFGLHLQLRNLLVGKSRLLHGHFLLGMTARFYPISLSLNESVFWAQVTVASPESTGDRWYQKGFAQTARRF